MKRILEGKPVRIFGNPENVRDYVHVDDIIEAVNACLQRREAFEIFNIGSGIGYSVLEILQEIEKVTCLEPVMEIDPLETGSSLIKSFVVNWEKAYRVLNWQPRISLEKGISMMYQGWTMNREPTLLVTSSG